MPVGINFIDEAQKVLNSRSHPLRVAGEGRQVHPHPSQALFGDIWLVTGTPFGGSFADLAEAPVRAFERSPSDDNARDEFKALFDRLFNDKLIIRDEADTHCMGSQITDIRKVYPEYIPRDTPKNQVHYVRMLVDTKVKDFGPRDAYFSMIQGAQKNTQFLYLTSMFPAATKILLDDPEVPFTNVDIRTLIRVENVTTGEALTTNKALCGLAEKISRSPRSLKLQYILDELDRMDKNRTTRPQLSKAGASASVQKDNTLKKMVIITPTVFTAVMLYMILARHHSRSGALLFHEDLLPSQKRDVMRRFKSLNKREGLWRCFIAPASAASESLNLQVANRLILTSPLLKPHQESQVLARVNREGQCFDVELRILLTEDSPIDRIIVVERAGTKFLSNPFNITEEVKVEFL